MPRFIFSFIASILLLLLISFLTGSLRRPAQAQDEPVSVPQQVFVNHNVNASGVDRLTFLNVLTGEPTTYNVDGDRYTVLGDVVLFLDRQSNRVKLLTLDGRTRDHPFIQPVLGGRRLDWLISEDQRLLAWTTTEGSGNALVTRTQVANVDGTDQRNVLVDGPREGIRALPVAFNREGTVLFMDYQPDIIGDLTPFRDYSGLFAVNLTTGETGLLPGEPGCFCGAALSGELFLRLSVSSDLTGFDMRVRDLTAQTSTTIPALRLSGFTQAGDVLVSPDATKATYVLAQIENFGAEDQSIRIVFVLADLEAGAQSALGGPITTFVRPIAWTEDNSGLLLTSPIEDGTWKIMLNDGELEQIATATYVGIVGQ